MGSGKSRGMSNIILAVLIVLIVISGVSGYYAGYNSGYQAGSSGISEVRQEGYKEGYDKGYAEGYQAAMKEVAPVLPNEIKIGCILSLSGDLGPMGQEILKGVKLAVEEVNARGGIRGRPIKLIVEDDETSDQKAVEVAKKLVEVDGVQVIIGPMPSGSLRAIGEYVNEKKVVTISPTATAPYITTLFPDDYVFRTVGSDTLQGKALADIIAKRGYKRVVTLVLNSPYGVGIEEEAKKIISDRIVLSIRYDPSKMDFRSELEQVKAANPDCVLFVGYYQSGKVMFRQALELGLQSITWVCAEGVYGEPMFEDPMAAEFMSIACIGTRPVAPIGSPSYELFAEKFKEKYCEEPPMYADTAYDATMMAIMAIAYCGNYSGPAIREALKIISQTYMGATGYKIFDENGDQYLQTYEIWGVVKEDGKYKFVNIGYWP